MTEPHDAVRLGDRQNRNAGAHGYLEWKGTNACVDLHCACGKSRPTTPRRRPPASRRQGWSTAESGWVCSDHGVEVRP